MMKMVLILTLMLVVLIMAMIMQFSTIPTANIHTALFGFSQNTTVPNITTPFPSVKVGENVLFLLA